MIKMADADQEQLYLCMLKLLEKGSQKNFEILRKLCEEISNDLPDLKTTNTHAMQYTTDENAKEQLNTLLVENRREDLDGFIPVKATGDGSCLFRALSFLCFGHENRHRELRVRCIIEMALNSSWYLEDLLERSKAESNYIEKISGKSENGITSNASESASDTEDHSTAKSSGDDSQPEKDSENSSGVGNQFSEFTKSVLHTCNPNAFATFSHIQALGVILERKIEIISSSSESSSEMPKELIELKKHFDRTIDPRDLDGKLNEQEKTLLLRIMWLLDNKHFVPLILSGTSTIDITTGDNVDVLLEKLGKLLGCQNIKEQFRLENPSIEVIQSLTGPKQMADPGILGISENTTVKFVAKLIEVQFQIKWKTKDGMPEEFNFYELCDVEKHRTHFNFHTRKAHVFAQLYRDAGKMKEVKGKDKQDFCPDVYVRVKNDWVRISFARKTCENVTDQDFEETFSWMHKSLRKFVAGAEKIKANINYKSVRAAIKEQPTLYWAVLKDTDFRRGDHLKLHGIGKTQVYVGKAEKGIEDRWIEDGRSHSNNMKKCADSICKMTSFDVSKLKGIQLVDARLLLAKLREENNAVFLIKTFKNKEHLKTHEKDHIKGDYNENIFQSCRDRIKGTWSPKKMEFGMNCRE